MGAGAIKAEQPGLRMRWRIYMLCARNWKCQLSYNSHEIARPLPDLGSDLDLYTTVSSSRVISTMESKFNAKFCSQLGRPHRAKMELLNSGLPEAIEIHIQRLDRWESTSRWRAGLTVVASSRRFWAKISLSRAGRADHRGDLQRMYRHFYFRVCDIVNSSAIVESGTLDLAELSVRPSLPGSGRARLAT